MDSPHLLHLGFLLLAVAASHPNIAMTSDDPAEGTQDSSSGKIRVAVYHCKDCESSTCHSEPISFENFEKIVETENEIFSNGIIELVTNESHILICFQQASSFPEGICGIGWEKAGGAGLMCGILNSGENGRGNISTEEYQICCEAETNIWESSSTMKCHTEPSGRKAFTPPTDIFGNPEFLTSEENSTGILCAFLFVGVCTGCGTIYYCLWLRRRGQASRQDRQASDEEHLTRARKPSTKEKTSLPAASSSFLMMCSKQPNNRLIFP